MEEAARGLANINGSGVFDGDAHALLTAIYKDETFPIEFRARCAEAAIKYEKPAKATVDLNDKREYVVRVPAPVSSPEEWRRLYGAPRGVSRAPGTRRGWQRKTPSASTHLASTAPKVD